MAQPRRLPGISYHHLATYFVTSVTYQRVKAFDVNEFGPLTGHSLLATSARFDFTVLAYVVMPDHVHALLKANLDGADLQATVKAWRQQTGFTWSRRHGCKLWQHGYWERVLREHETPLSVARYIVENPVRAGLVTHPREYPLCGSAAYTMEEMCEAVQFRAWGK